MMDPARYALARPVNAWLLALFCLIGGVIAFLEIPRLEDPEFTIKEAVIVTPYPGASAWEVETQVTEPLESAIQQLDQLDEIRSRSLPGASEIRVVIHERFRSNELPQIWDELRRKVNDAQAELPPGAGASIVNDDFGDVFGMFYAITGDGLTLTELHDTAKSLRRSLLRVEGVGKIEISGVVQERILVEVDSARLAASGIAPQEIAAALNDADRATDAGSIRAGAMRFPLRPGGAFDSVETIRALPVGQGDRMVRLGDVADITRDMDDRPDQIIRYNGQPAVTLGVSGQSSVNVVEVGKGVERELKQLQNRIPLGVEISPIYEQHRVVDEAISGFAINVVMAVAIVIGTLCLAMGWRAGVVIGIVLLLTVGGTLLIMWIGGFELERVSLGALVIAMGPMVDNTVVICDGMMVRLRQGEKMVAAASKTVRQTQWTLLGATLIGILAFAGIGLSQDQTGEFMFSLFVTIAVSLLLSWGLGITLVPLFARYLLQVGDADESDDPYQGKLYSRFRSVLHGFVLRRYVTLLGLVVLTVVAVFAFRFVPQSFFPESTTPLVYVDMQSRQGNDIQTTAAHAADIEKALSEIEGVTFVATHIGAGATRFMLTYAPQQPDPSYAQFLIRIDDPDAVADIVAALNRDLPEQFPEHALFAKQFMFGPNAESTIEARFIGDSVETLRALSAQASHIMEIDHGLRNVRDDWLQPVMGLHPDLDLDRLAQHGLTRQDVALALQSGYDGAPQGVFREGDELIPILLRASEGDRMRADNIMQRLVWSAANEAYIPLGQVANGIDVLPEDGVIHRRDRVRAISVRAEPAAGESATEAHSRIREAIEGIELPEKVTMEWGGEFETSDDASAALASTLLLPFLGMLVITVVMFAAVKQAIVIWLVVPMAICGVTFGLLVSGQPFGFMALLGLLSLTGMLIKNAIVLVEEIERQIRAEVPRMKAILDASVSRLRPVTMAAGTTVVGVIPLLFDPFFANMAVTIMGGLAFATVLTLIAVPCLYVVFFKVKENEC